MAAAAERKHPFTSSPATGGLTEIKESKYLVGGERGKLVFKACFVVLVELLQLFQGPLQLLCPLCQAQVEARHGRLQQGNRGLLCSQLLLQLSLQSQQKTSFHFFFRFLSITAHYRKVIVGSMDHLGVVRRLPLALPGGVQAGDLLAGCLQGSSQPLLSAEMDF